MPFHTKHITCAAAVIFFFVVTATAQNGSTAQIDEFVKAEMQRQHLPGVSLAIVKTAPSSMPKAMVIQMSNIKCRLNLKLFFSQVLLASSSLQPR